MNKSYTEAVIKSIDETEGSFVASISSGKVDRVGDILNPDGWDFRNFKKNPVILWSHDNEALPVAKAERIWKEDKEIMLKGVFAPTDFAQEVRKLVQGGFLNAMSVGFQPTVDPEIDSKGNRVFPANELLEVSWVNVPALPSALVASRKMNLNLVTKELEAIQEESKVEEKANGDKCSLEDGTEGEIFTDEDGNMVCIPIEAEEERKLEFSKEYANNLISKLEEAINALKGLPETQTPDESVSQDIDKGRKDKFVKQSYEAELRILSLADKSLEIIRHKLINKTNK